MQHIAVAGEPGFIGLIAPAALQAAFAEGRPVRLRVRIRPAAVPGDGSGAGAMGTPASPTGSAQGVIVISTQPLRPQASRPPAEAGHKV